MTISESGRELDAAVAEEVMGWRWIDDARLYGRHSPVLLTPALVAILSPEYVREHTSPTTGEPPRSLPAYSSSWDAAASVFTKLVDSVSGERGGVIIETSAEGVFTIYEDWREMEDGNALAEGSSLPEAICKAALAWVRSTKSTGPKVQKGEGE